MRCFIGAFVPVRMHPAFVDARPDVEAVRWVTPEKYHLTLEFLGDIEPCSLATYLDVAAAFDVAFPIDCVATTVDGFPRRRHARVIVATVESNGMLEALVDRDDFSAHVTLGRARRRPIRLPESAPLDIRFRLSDAGLYESIGGRYERVSRRDA